MRELLPASRAKSAPKRNRTELEAIWELAAKKVGTGYEKDTYQL